MAESAVAAAGKVIGERYGEEFATEGRRYKTKAAGAQEAHEAIRPTEMARSPEKLGEYILVDYVSHKKKVLGRR